MAIPVSIFFSVPHQKLFDHYIRFCFVKVTDMPGEGRAPQSSPGLLGRGVDWSVLVQDESTLRAMDQKLQKWKAELTP